MARLRWRGPAGDVERELDAPVLRIGRGTENEIVVDESAVSRVHARLESEAGTWRIVDVGSTNGTVVGDTGDPIAPNTPVPLADGEQIHVGAWTAITVRRYSGEV